MQPHLKKAFTLLAIAIIGFIVVRSFIVPVSFGQYGWYRGDAIIDSMNFEIRHAGSATCGEENCHNSIYSIWIDSKHKTVNCETCHGPSEKHVNNVRIMPEPVNDTRDFCGMCHFKSAARPEEFPQIDPDTHGENLRCAYCHNPHKPWFV
ncbi:MAG: hypothetical protein J5U17_05825 [Candidatus Methanoperedens sp.]|nr:hypothetical protein [Candidatus Methanoperedens sp.]MCE8425279.1 hypothetical protein [Candidatus Methanoperedens sp.]MCE8427800.1 hypothetical protein [Candidatus Methanoperedens sp.]